MFNRKFEQDLEVLEKAIENDDNEKMVETADKIMSEQLNHNKVDFTKKNF